jgi:hypothetical protein
VVVHLLSKCKTLSSTPSITKKKKKKKKLGVWKKGPSNQNDVESRMVSDYQSNVWLLPQALTK